MADVVIEIPVRGMANSINVGTAAAVVLYSISSRAMRFAIYAISAVARR